MQTELKPCPFCGGRPKATILMGDRIATCETTTCGNKGMPYLDADWNERAPGGSEGPVDVEAAARRYMQNTGHGTQCTRFQIQTTYAGECTCGFDALASTLRRAPEGKEKT